ncbi:hypothetical protein [Paraglaciecola chathamensis]|uniref:Transmembrane anchor protein n=1 Tax=Paraglaciecola chathamensis S18K6 TaxID=1127672 RepID=A0AAV3UTT8_9ALTE|nr:hypothetical protein [Paraglaciecola chathamensis]GAC08325.1 hypothetical protein GCHA_0361 [Paraglaciecola chathamensis S18K6]
MTAQQHVEVSNQQIIKGLGIAVAVAVVLSVTVVLPAEYNKDITGIGKILGLTSINNAAVGEDMEITSDADFILAGSQGEFATKTLVVEIPEYEGIEVKALMQANNGMSFSWHTDGTPLYMDMHGEKLENPNEFESYKKAKSIAADNGIFKAPFEGTHGWYWQNMSDDPITVTVTVAGFYQSIKTKN